jgi:hypothetical protein
MIAIPVGLHATVYGGIMHEPRPTQQRKRQPERFTSRDIPPFIAAIAALITAIVAAAAFFAGRATGAPAPTETVTVTAPAPKASGGSSASSSSNGTPISSGAAPLKNALLSAQVVGSGMSASNSIDSFLSNVTQNAEVCTGQPADSASPTISEELTDSPKSTTIFTERIINWGSSTKAAQAITKDEAALGQSGCNFASNQTTQNFTAPTSVAAPQECGSGDELVASVGLSSTVPSSDYSSYSGYFIETQCETFAISIEDMQTSFLPQDQVNGYLNHAAGQLLSTIR